jgi:hypothetical protein
MQAAVDGIPAKSDDPKFPLNSRDKGFCSLLIGFPSLHPTSGRKTYGVMSLSLFGALISVAHATSTCYYPNGVASHGGACGSNSEGSACCGPSFVCLSNGLCAVGPESRRSYAYEYYRSSCTDPYWKSASCPQFCIECKYAANKWLMLS